MSSNGVSDVFKKAQYFIFHSDLGVVLICYGIGVAFSIPVKAVRAAITWLKYRSIYAGNVSKVGLFPNWTTGGFDRPGVVMVGAQKFDFLASLLTIFFSWIYILCVGLLICFVLYERFVYFFAPSNIRDAQWRFKYRNLTKEQAMEDFGTILNLDEAGRKQFAAEVEYSLRELARD